jgi:hypothetical protein
VPDVALISLVGLVVLVGVTAALLYTWRRDVVKQRRALAAFRSSEEFFQAVDALIARLEGAGHQEAARELRDGLRCLNGLTDGSALFLDSIEKVQATESERFTREDQQALETIRARVHVAVYRR